ASGIVFWDPRGVSPPVGRCALRGVGTPRGLLDRLAHELGGEPLIVAVAGGEPPSPPRSRLQSRREAAEVAVGQVGLDHRSTGPYLHVEDPPATPADLGAHRAHPPRRDLYRHPPPPLQPPGSRPPAPGPH